MFEYTALVDAPVQRFTGIVTGPDPDEVPALADRARVARPAPPPSRDVAPSPSIAPSRPMAPQLRLSAAVEPARRPSVASTGSPSPHAEPVRTARTRPHQPAVLPAVAAVAAVALSTLWLLRRGPHGRAR